MMMCLPKGKAAINAIIIVNTILPQCIYLYKIYLEHYSQINMRYA